jgi:hypothetical protein
LEGLRDRYGLHFFSTRNSALRRYTLPVRLAVWHSCRQVGRFRDVVGVGSRGSRPATREGRGCSQGNPAPAHMATPPRSRVWPVLAPGTESRTVGEQSVCSCCVSSACTGHYLRSTESPVPAPQPRQTLLPAPIDAPAAASRAQGAFALRALETCAAVRIPRPRFLCGTGAERKSLRPSSGHCAQREVQDGEQGAAGYCCVALRGDPGRLCG